MAEKLPGRVGDYPECAYRPINEAVARLNTAVEGLREQRNLLTDRLSVVLSHPFPEDGSNPSGKSPDGTSPLACELNDIARAFELIAADFAELRERVEA